MTVREEPSPLTGGPRRRPGRHHRPRRSDPRRASRAWSRAPAQKQRPRRRTTSGRGGQGPRSPGSSSAEAIGGARGSSRRHHGTETPENGAAAIGSGGRRGGGTPGAPVGRRPQAQSVRPAGARAELAGLGDRLAGRRSPRRRAGRAGSRSPARSRPTADRQRSSRQTRRNVGPLPADGGLASARAGLLASLDRHDARQRPREREGGADSARGATLPRPERATPGGSVSQPDWSNTPAPGTRDGAPRGGLRRPRASPPRDPCTAGRRLHVIPRRARAPPGVRNLHGNRPAAPITFFVHKDN